MLSAHKSVLYAQCKKFTTWLLQEFLKILREREKQKMADKMKEFHAVSI